MRIEFTIPDIKLNDFMSLLGRIELRDLRKNEAEETVSISVKIENEDKESMRSVLSFLEDMALEINSAALVQLRETLGEGTFETPTQDRQAIKEALLLKFLEKKCMIFRLEDQDQFILEEVLKEKGFFFETTSQLGTDVTFRGIDVVISNEDHNEFLSYSMGSSKFFWASTHELAYCFNNKKQVHDFCIHANAFIGDTKTVILHSRKLFPIE